MDQVLKVPGGSIEQSVEPPFFVQQPPGVVGYQIATEYVNLNQVIGVSRGEFTEYIFVESTNGAFHGYPITEAELREMGVEL